MNNIKQYETELDSICVELKQKHSQTELSDAFKTLMTNDDELDPSWSEATKDVWHAMDKLYKKYSDENDVEDGFCGISILFEDMQPKCVD